MPRGVKKVAEITEEVKVEEAVAEAPAEEVKEEKVEEAAVAEAPAEEPVAEEAAPEVAEEVPAEEVKEEPKKEEKKAEKEEAPAASADGEWKFVENLRIYPRVTDLAVTTVITGNVKVIGEVRGLKKIQYMKHGFGLVDALTDAL